MVVVVMVVPQIGMHVSEVVHRRFGSTILELGGNNATIGRAEPLGLYPRSGPTVCDVMCELLQ